MASIATTTVAARRMGFVGPAHDGTHERFGQSFRQWRMLPIPFLYPVWRAVLAKVERWLEPPIMRERINRGSDRYFDWRDEHGGESALDDLFGTRSRDDDEDD